MLNDLQSKIEGIASNYVDLVEQHLQTAAAKEKVDGVAMNEINEGIHILNHIIASLERINCLQVENNADASFSKYTASLARLTSILLQKVWRKCIKRNKL